MDRKVVGCRGKARRRRDGNQNSERGSLQISDAAPLTTGASDYKPLLSTCPISSRFPLKTMPDSSLTPQTRSFNPYTENGGTILAIAGQDFSVIAGDTRQSEGYSIQTRYAPKVFRLYAADLSPVPLRCRFLTLRIWTGPIAQSWL